MFTMIKILVPLSVVALVSACAAYSAGPIASAPVPATSSTAAR